jgi:HTH-type transcriptional regulator/antitoxin MqsA
MAEESFQRAAAAVRREYELLEPNEIREIRAMYGLSQASLERLIHSGEKTVVRWERGSVAQNATADTLLRVLRDHPEVVRRLASQRGVKVVLPEPAQTAA